MATNWVKHNIEVGMIVLVRPACIRRAKVLEVMSNEVGGSVVIEYEDGGLFAGYTLPKTGVLYNHEVEPCQ